MRCTAAAPAALHNLNAHALPCMCWRAGISKANMPLLLLLLPPVSRLLLLLLLLLLLMLLKISWQSAAW
jgi:hypothetical protein